MAARRKHLTATPAVEGPERGVAGTTTPVLQLQRAAGNRAVSALIARTPAGGAGAGGAVRKIVLDANVFDQIARGNVAAAKALRELTATQEVYVSWQALTEWVIKTNDVKQSNAVRRIIDVLGIRAAPPAPASVLADVTAKNSFTKGERTATVLARDTDLKVAADAKALDAEVWSFDRGFRKNSGSVEKRLGVKVAPETKTIEMVSGKTRPDHNAALRAVGIEEDAIAGQLPAGKDPVPHDTPAGGGGGAAAHEAEDTAGKGVEKAAVKEGEHAAEGLGKAAVKEGEHAAEAVGKLAVKKGGKLAAKIGMAIVEGLIPDPLDAIGLMVDFAGSYTEARDAIRKSNLSSGVAIGLSAYLVVQQWEWAKGFALTSASRDVVTEFLGAAGVAENAFNEGLVRGYLYGERHSPAQADTLRQKAFNTLRKLDRTPGYVVQEETETDGEVRQFGRDDVYLFASVLAPTADAMLAEADRRREARLAAERAKERREDWSRPVGNKI